MTATPARVRAAALAVAAVAALSGCAAGQIAQTANEVSAIDGVNRNAGPVAIRALAVQTPSGSSYAQGDSAQLTVVLVNTGSASDSLVGITGAKFSSWQAAQGSASSGSASASAPSSSSSAASISSQQVTVAPGSSVAFGTPNAVGTLTITGLKSTLYPGDSITLTMRFQRAGSVTTSVPVQVSTSAPTATIEPPSGSSGE